MSCASKSHIGLPVIHHGLYVMYEGLPVMQRVCLSHAMTAIMIHVCCDDVTSEHDDVINVM